MREMDIIEKLREDIAVPDIVQEKADMAFDRIKKEKENVVMIYSRKKKWKTMWFSIAAAVLALGTTVCAAVYLNRSKGLESEFQMTQAQKLLLEEQEYMAPLAGDSKTHDSVTVEGVTITPLQMIVDNRFAWLSFRVEGYDLEEGKEPCFGMTDFVLNNDREAFISSFGSFYNGLHLEEDGVFCYDDGTVAEDAQGNVIAKYVDEEGYMEYIVEINGASYEQGLVGSSVHVTFEDLGTVYKATFTEDLKAVWEFDLELKGSDEIRKVTLSEPLGDSGATVIYAEISPISLHAEYDFPLQEVEIEGVNENGEAITSTDFAQAPDLIGVRLKDGTLLSNIQNGGTNGYGNGNTDIYQVSYAISHVIEPSQVDALLFIKSEPVAGENHDYEWTEENFYIVPIE